MAERNHEALVRRGTGLEVTSVPTISPGPGGILVEMSYVGVCGTDLQILNRTRPDSAEILGHEGAGVVIEAGAGAPLLEGQQVVFNPSAQLPKGRILGHNVSGLFQRYFTVDAAAVEDGLVIAADGFPALCGALVEPLGGIIYAHQLISRAVPDLRSAVIFGAGPIGLLIAEYLRGHGIATLLVHPSQKRLDSAIELGLARAADMIAVDDHLLERILAWNGEISLDAALICTSMTGAATALNWAVQVLKDGGCVEMVTNYPEWERTPDGITTSEIRATRAANICGTPASGKYVSTQIHGRRITFTGHRGTSSAHLLEAMRTLSSHTTKYTSFITHVFSLHDAARGVESLATMRSARVDGKDCVKAVVNLAN